MKKILYLMVFLCCNVYLSSAQREMKKTLKDIAKTDSVVCFGLDFANAKFVGDFPNRKNILESGFDTWNSMLVSSDILKKYKEEPFLYDFTPTSKVNRLIKENDIFSILPQSLTVEKIQKIIASYDPVIKKGKAIVFIVESFDKNLEEARIWFVYFQIETRQILHTEVLVSRAFGINVINHWGTAIQRAIKTSAYPNSRFLSNSFFYIFVATCFGLFIYYNKGF
jgi:hypothetical protein